jgi:hypothetical protein
MACCDFATSRFVLTKPGTVQATRICFILTPASARVTGRQASAHFLLLVCLPRGSSSD